MPYITPDLRQWWDERLAPVEEHIGKASPGELTYLLYRLCVTHTLDSDDNYQTRNTVLGCLSATAQEYYRRQCADYEDAKRFVNGDIFDEYDVEATGGTGDSEGYGSTDLSGQAESTDRVGAGQVRASGNGGAE